MSIEQIMKLKRKISATDCKKCMGHQTGMFIASNDRNNSAPCNFQEKHTEQSYHKSHHKRKLPMDECKLNFIS